MTDRLFATALGAAAPRAEKAWTRYGAAVAAWRRDPAAADRRAEVRRAYEAFVHAFLPAVEAEAVLARELPRLEARLAVPRSPLPKEAAE